VSGTASYISKFTATTTLGNSNIYEGANGNIGIGTTTTGAKLTFLSSSNSAAPPDISFSQSYANTAGTAAKQLIKLFYDGTSCYGLGVSSGQLEIMTYSTGIHAFYNGGTLVAQLNANGNLGVGVTPSSYKGDFNGQVHATSFPTSSDIRFKKNIIPISNALNKVLKLQGVTYEWNEFINNIRDGYTLNTPILGFIAQDVEKIVPEVITKWELNDECKDARAIDYPRIVALLTEAIKEQQLQINDLKNRVIMLEKR